MALKLQPKFSLMDISSTQAVSAHPYRDTVGPVGLSPHRDPRLQQQAREVSAMNEGEITTVDKLSFKTFQ